MSDIRKTLRKRWRSEETIQTILDVIEASDGIGRVTIPRGILWSCCRTCGRVIYIRNRVRCDECRAERQSWVYFIQQGENGPIKIGHSVDPRVRMASLQTGCGEPLRLLLTIPGGRAREQEIQTDHLDDYVGGEWFRPSAALLEYIEKLR